MIPNVETPTDPNTTVGDRWVEGLFRMPTESELPSSDGIPVETPRHCDAASLLLDSVRYFARDREDWWCAADIFLYFNLDMLKNRDFRGPDFFFVKGVPKRERDSYVVWEENGHYPNVVVEIASPTTVEKDYGIKKHIYETVFQTPEYFIVDLEMQTIDGWKLVFGEYRAIAPVDGKLRCEQLGLDLGFYRHSILHSTIGEAEIALPRFFYYDGRLAPTLAEVERQKADAASRRADAERQKADAALQRADAAEAANAELLRELAALKARFARPNSETP